MFQYFSAHPKWQGKLEETIVETQPELTVLKLKILCRTRWNECIDALGRFQKLYSSIVACMERIRSEGTSRWSPDAVTDASILLYVSWVQTFPSISKRRTGLDTSVNFPGVPKLVHGECTSLKPLGNYFGSVSKHYCNRSF